MKYSTVDVTDDNRIQAIKWTKQMFGKAKGPDGTLKFHEMTWWCLRLESGARFYFKNPSHASWFSLKWV